MRSGPGTSLRAPEDPIVSRERSWREHRWRECRWRQHRWWQHRWREGPWRDGPWRECRWREDLFPPPNLATELSRPIAQTAQG